MKPIIITTLVLTALVVWICALGCAGTRIVIDVPPATNLMWFTNVSWTTNISLVPRTPDVLNTNSLLTIPRP